MSEHESLEKIREQRILASLGIRLEGGFPNEIGEAVFHRALYSSNEKAVLTKDSSLSGKHCLPVGSLDVCGNGETDGDGVMKIRLEDFICLRRARAGENFDRIEPPLYFVATPVRNGPVVLTFELQRSAVESDPFGVDIEVFSWDLAGEPKPRVKFQWRCCVKYLPDVVG